MWSTTSPTLNPCRGDEMRDLFLAPFGRPLGAPPLRVLAIGAHCDDIEIGAGGTLSAWADQARDTAFSFVVLTSTPERSVESRACLAALVAPCSAEITIHELRDSRLPDDFDRVKDILATLSATPWDVVLTHHRHDAHQDHRLLGELAPTAFRDHLLLQFEIPKWDGDLGASRPNLYQRLTPQQIARKWAALDQHYASQRNKDWWSEETFSALARLRGLECRAPYAEAFRVDKVTLGPLRAESGVARE